MKTALLLLKFITVSSTKWLYSNAVKPIFLIITGTSILYAVAYAIGCGLASLGFPMPEGESIKGEVGAGILTIILLFASLCLFFGVLNACTDVKEAWRKYKEDNLGK